MSGPARSAAVLVLVSLWCSCPSARGGQPNLDEALAGVKIPPDWLADVPVRYDTSKPWKDARLHIRSLLAEGRNREAIKLTYDYLVVRKVNKDTHEYPLYLYLGGEHAWAAKVYMDRLRSKPEGQTHAYRCLASLYLYFGEPEKALETLRTAMERPPKPPWRIANIAKLHDHMGDVYARMGQADRALEHYRTAARMLPKSRQPWGRHLLHRHAEKIEAKMDLLSRQRLDVSRLPDGDYRGRSLGYAKDLRAVVTLRDGRIADIRLQHQEKIDQGATRLIPERILRSQSLSVDAITGATITCEAIVEAVYRALQKADRQ